MEFSMNYKLCELYNKNILSQYEQNTHFIQIAPFFRYSFHCFGMLQVRENEISLRDSFRFLQNWPDELWKLGTANIALHSVFTQMSELNIND